MSVLGGWGVSAPRFDTIQDWTSLTNVNPGGTGKTRLRRSVSTTILPSQQTQHPAGSQMAGVGSPPGRGFGASSVVAQQRLAEQGTGRTPTSAFANNPYQLNRGSINSAVASSLTGGSPTLGTSPSTHQFAIHQLPRAASSTGGRAASASVRRSASPIAIPAGGALPLSPSNSTSVANRRQTLIQQQAALSQSRQRADSMPGTSPLGSDGYNPYLLADASMPASQQMFRKTKNLEQRLAEYLKPPRVSPNAAATSSPGGAGSVTSPVGSPTNARGNISVNVLLHPKTPLGSLTSPTGAAFSTVTAANKEMLARASAAAREEKDNDGRGSPLRGRKGDAIDEDELAAAQAAELMASVKKGKSKAVAAEEEAAAAAAAIAAAAAAESAKPPEDDGASDSANQAPAASMNLRAVLKEKKAQELEAKAAAARDQEAKKPWTGISWHDVVQARLFLLAHNKARLAAQASGLPVPDLKEEVRTKNINALALQVATNWLNSTSLKSAKKPFNIFTLSEYQRQEYKVAQEQGKWLSMVAKEDAAATTTTKKELDYLPNDQKRISSKTRMMNMCKGEVTQQQAGSSSSSNDGSSGSGAGSSSSSSGGGLGAKSSLLYNTYVSCNGQYGYVRYVGRVSWGSGLWVGMELVEKHPYAASANAPWVDFWHEHSAVSMQLIEETAEQKAEQRKRVRALMTGTVADQIAAASTGGPTSQMMINTLIPRPLLMAAMIAPVKDKTASSKSSSSASGEKEKIVGTAEGQFQPLSNSIFPFIDVVAFLREGLAGCFEMGEVDPGFAYFAPMDSVRRVALKAKIDNKALLSAKEHQTNPFADVDDLATNTPKKHEGNIEMLARYLTVSDREVLDGDRNKARSIFRWICHNIRYDPTGTGTGAAGAAAPAAPVVGSKATDVISIIRHRRATAEGFAQLFHALCVAGGLQCLRIRGVEKQLNHRTDQVLRNKHAWNAIKVDGEWSFVDCVFSCGQWVDPPSGSSASAQAAQALARASVHQGTWAQMFSDAYFCTPPSLFILEHFPTSCDDPFNKVLPQEYNNLQLLRSVVSASEFEKGLIPGRAFVEYQMRASPFTYAVECKQPSYQIEITAPSFILFDVDLSIKSHVVDLNSCSHICYDGESVTIYLVFPVPGEYVVKITCKPSWRELDIYDKCLTYRLTSHTGLVPLASNKDVIIGFLQHRKMNARDSRGMFNRHFTLLHPLSGHLIPKAPFIVQLKGPEIVDSVIVACNGDWQRLSSSILSKSTTSSGGGGPGSGVRMFEGTCVIQPRYDLQIFYEHDKKFHLLFYYRANLTSFSNVYLEKDKAAAIAAASSSSTSSFLTQDLWHGKFGRALCIFVIHVSTAWDVALQVQEGWRNGTPLQDNQVVVEEMKNARTAMMTQYRITTTLPATALLNPAPEEPKSSPTNKLRSAISSVIGAGSSMPAGVQAAADFANSLAEGPEKRRALEEAERRRRIDNKIPYASSSSSSNGKDEDAPKASTQYVLVINARNIKQGGPMRYCLSYFFDVAKAGQQAATTNQAQLQLTTDD